VDVAGRTLAIVGRLSTVPRRAAVDEVERRGGTVRRDLTRQTAYLVVGGGAGVLLDGRLQTKLDRADALGVPVSSERTFLRALGLLSPLEPEPAAISRDELARRAGLDAHIIRLLQLFDVIGAPGDGCSFRDLITAREVARLLREGTDLCGILDGVGRIGGQDGTPESHPLARHKLVCDAEGHLVMRTGDRIAELDGQMRLPFPPSHNPSIDALFEEAEDAEQDGDLALAEELYRRYIALDRRDPIAPFNLANVLWEQGRNHEAACFLQLAVSIDPNFAEAWYNLANLMGLEQRAELERAYLMKAVAADPEYGEPVYNIALLHFQAEEYEEAVEWWQRYLKLDPDSEWSRKARKGLALCHQQLQDVR
jgi:TolA-binding protein